MLCCQDTLRVDGLLIIFFVLQVCAHVYFLYEQQSTFSSNFKNLRIFLFRTFFLSDFKMWLSYVLPQGFPKFFGHGTLFNLVNTYKHIFMFCGPSFIK
jgi:hypothetical protein